MRVNLRGPTALILALHANRITLYISRTTIAIVVAKGATEFALVVVTWCKVEASIQVGRALLEQVS